MLAIEDGPLPRKLEVLSSITKIGGRATFMQCLQEKHTGVLSSLRQACLCRRCGSQLFLLTQCYCPLRDGRNRMMYVFACNDAQCAASGSDAWRCFSIEINADDDVDEDEGGDDEEEEGADGAAKVAASWWAAQGDWNAFPPLATYVAPEPDLGSVTATGSPTSPSGATAEAEEMKKMEAINAESSMPDADVKQLGEEIDLKDKPTDVAYNEFSYRVEKEPRQVLRYQRNGVPIFMNPDATIQLVVPPCAHCGGLRAMEMQVMPTAIYLLQVDKHLPKDGKQRLAAGATLGLGLDFGTVTVYTCMAGCTKRYERGTEGADAPDADAASAPVLTASDSLRKDVVVDVLVREEFLFVEPPPMEDHEAAAEGRMTMKQLVQGTAGP